MKNLADSLMQLMLAHEFTDGSVVFCEQQYEAWLKQNKIQPEHLRSIEQNLITHLIHGLKSKHLTANQAHEILVQFITFSNHDISQSIYAMARVCAILKENQIAGQSTAFFIRFKEESDRIKSHSATQYGCESIHYSERYKTPCKTKKRA
ncbi:hypothetical protein [Pleionea sp. CnH1-48]|uniref:hypothetical protein n=1 Tax=Pleionea sp. CnH1-48 TaxID=2954494 RepID=UPI00209788DE|nr:hypothetical protein [Pleionea sp. CnH1-48]MCO7223629.1 hypothetical protein [Pleionea sp. CnH1-48]